VNPIRGVLLDIDGTLLDTREEWVRAFNESLRAVGHGGLPPAEVVRWIGAPFPRILEEACGLSGERARTVEEEFVRREHEILREGVRAYPGIPAALRRLARWRLGAVTNKRTETARLALDLAGLLTAFTAVVGGDATQRKKPAPDPVRRAAALLGLDPTACALVGDTENDVLAGKVAGARTVGVTWGYGGRRRLEAAGVDFLIEAPEALEPLLRALTPSTAP